MDITTLIGLWAAGFTTFAFLPQAIRVWQYRQTKDISLSMYLVFVCGISLWLIYGILINDIPIILANAVTLVLSISILIAKLKFG